ncbi:hypothetical protein [Biformimicrobium ophioploci]|uniref:Thioredoxin domain-containing protein n=1 Tax=Biformimicrobium ophioploci TaxID=3036711 RepID=A0ABQ6LV76_9GAMM|nr:hypothetical protein [Microbulbifer sp. NKW57]GMG86006.1 hypothetical protein MNKW57_03270 [Microbulbifer sp. NKW57]
MNISESPAGTQQQSQPRRLGRLKGLAVMAVVGLPMVAASLIYHTGVGMPTGTSNKGELLQPATPVTELALVDSALQPLDLTGEIQADAKWRYVILGGDHCDAQCEDVLYTTRQVHVRLGEKARRVERIFLTTSELPQAQREKIQSEHPRLQIAHTSAADLSALLRNTSHAGLLDQGPSSLLVDQQGFAMMVYRAGTSGGDLLKDIKKLLKYSYEK